MTFNELTEQLFVTLVQNKNNEKPQYVDRPLALKAYYILSHMYIRNEADLLLYCICMCLINTYVKQNDGKTLLIHKTKRGRKHDYWWKEPCSYKVINASEYIPYKNIYISFNPRERWNQSCFFVQIDDLQFSFHSENLKFEWIISPKKWNQQVFNEMQNKKAIVTMFDLVMNEKHLLTNKSLEGTSLIESMNCKIDQIINLDDDKLVEQLQELVYEPIMKLKRDMYKVIDYARQDYKYEMNPWEYFQSSGEEKQIEIFRYYQNYVKPQKEIISELNGKIVSLSKWWMVQNPKQTANIIQMLANHKAKFAMDVKECNLFVKNDAYDDRTGILPDENFEYATSNNIYVISLQELLKILGTSEYELLKMDYPSSKWIYGIKSQLPNDAKVNHKKSKRNNSVLENGIDDGTNPFARLNMEW